jgi:hypothetical protein
LWKEAHPYVHYGNNNYLYRRLICGYLFKYRQSQIRKNLFKILHKQKSGAKTLHTLSHIRLTQIALPWKRNRLLFGRPCMVNVRLIGKADYNKIDISHLDIYCAYRYFSDNIYAILFTDMVSRVRGNLIKIITTVLRKIITLVSRPI